MGKKENKITSVSVDSELSPAILRPSIRSFRGRRIRIRIYRLILCTSSDRGGESIESTCKGPPLYHCDIGK
jgi:hypothetical protein